MVDKTAYRRGIAYTKRNLKKGLVRVFVWVPKEKRDEFLEFARKLREAADD